MAGGRPSPNFSHRDTSSVTEQNDPGRATMHMPHQEVVNFIGDSINQVRLFSKLRESHGRNDPTQGLTQLDNFSWHRSSKIQTIFPRPYYTSFPLIYDFSSPGLTIGSKKDCQCRFLTIITGMLLNRGDTMQAELNKSVCGVVATDLKDRCYTALQYGTIEQWTYFLCLDLPSHASPGSRCQS